MPTLCFLRRFQNLKQPTNEETASESQMSHGAPGELSGAAKGMSLQPFFEHGEN